MRILIRVVVDVPDSTDTAALTTNVVTAVQRATNRSAVLTYYGVREDVALIEPIVSLTQFDYDLLEGNSL